MSTVPTPKEANKLGEMWRPYRTVASLYLWNMKNGDIDPATKASDKTGIGSTFDSG
jgi:3-methyladenine DNA glycosylase/8-oxoguanine DNA glycosylase